MLRRTGYEPESLSTSQWCLCFLFTCVVSSVEYSHFWNAMSSEDQVETPPSGSLQSSLQPNNLWVIRSWWFAHFASRITFTIDAESLRTFKLEKKWRKKNVCAINAFRKVTWYGDVKIPENATSASRGPIILQSAIRSSRKKFRTRPSLRPDGPCFWRRCAAW